MSNADTSVRLDKFLWAVRLFRTRSLATEACKNGRVTIHGQPAKASREVRVGETIVAANGEVTRTVKVLELLLKRVGAPLVFRYVEELTPKAATARKFEPDFRPIFVRPKGSGRPTKRNRRELEKLQEKRI